MYLQTLNTNVKIVKIPHEVRIQKSSIHEKIVSTIVLKVTLQKWIYRYSYMRISPHYSKRRKLDKPYRRGLGDGPAELVPQLGWLTYLRSW